MNLSIRSATAEDLPEIARVDALSFGDIFSEADMADAFAGVDLSRFLLASSDGELVGIAGDYPLSMTLPGGAQPEVPGVTWVSVAPNRRRQGVLRTLLHTQFENFRDSGYPVAALTASQGGIYGRFGYGPASLSRRTIVDPRRAQLIEAGDASRVELLNAEGARRRAPELHERWRRLVPGAVSRSEARWDTMFRDRESRRGGLSPNFYLVHPDGFIAYRTKTDWAHGHPQHLGVITDYFPVTAQAHSDLWEVLFGLELFGRIESYFVPIDDPLPFKLRDPRQLRTAELNDGMWIRPIDVAAALQARTYQVEVDACLAVVDPVFGDGRYRLRGGPDGASCARTEDLPDVSLPASALGACYLGGTRLSVLRAAGALDCEDAALLRRLDAAFQANRAPFHGTGF